MYAALFFRFLAILVVSGCVHALDGGTPRIRPLNGWKAIEVISEGEEIGGSGWEMPNDFDGLGAFIVDPNAENPIVRIHVNHEKSDDSSISEVNLKKNELKQAIANKIQTNNVGGVKFVRDARLAYDNWSTDGGATLRSNVDPDDTGFCKFCSGQSYKPNTFGPNRGFVDQLYITGEECDDGDLYVLDSRERVIYRLSGFTGSSNDQRGGMPRGPWENAALLDTGETHHVALLLSPDGQGDDEYLQLYIGQKGKNNLGQDATDVLSRNGLAYGEYFYLRSNFPSEGNTNQGGTLTKQTSGALNDGKFEDVDTNPNNPTQVVVAETTTGLFVLDFDFRFTPPDVGGLDDTANVRRQFNATSTSFTITRIPVGEIRRCDNVDWSADGLIYINEDDDDGEIWYQAIDGSPRTKIGETTTEKESAGIFDLSEFVDYSPGQIMITSNMGDPASLTILINPNTAFGPAPKPTNGDIYEAEDAALFNATIERVQDGYSGGGYIDIIGRGGSVEWEIDIVESGTYFASIAYAAASDRPAYILLDGVQVGIFDFEATAGWREWTVETTIIDLEVGRHTLKISAEQSDGPNIDWLAIGLTTASPTRSPIDLNAGVVPYPSGATIYEAEFADTIVLSTIESMHSGYSGTGYIDMIRSGASVEWEIDNLALGAYEVSLAYAGVSFDRPANLRVDGAIVGTFACTVTSNWSDWRLETMLIDLVEQGSHTLAISADESIGPNIDWMGLRSIGVNVTVPTSTPSASPTGVPSSAPTSVPTDDPSAMPTSHPTNTPTDSPTATASQVPTISPMPSPSPSATKTASPTKTTPIPSATLVPQSQAPAVTPTKPTKQPTIATTSTPTIVVPKTSVPTILPPSPAEEEPSSGDSLAALYGVFGVVGALALLYGLFIVVKRCRPKNNEGAKHQNDVFLNPTKSLDISEEVTMEPKIVNTNNETTSETSETKEAMVVQMSKDDHNDDIEDTVVQTSKDDNNIDIEHDTAETAPPPNISTDCDEYMAC